MKQLLLLISVIFLVVGFGCSKKEADKNKIKEKNFEVPAAANLNNEVVDESKDKIDENLPVDQKSIDQKNLETAELNNKEEKKIENNRDNRDIQKEEKKEKEISVDLTINFGAKQKAFSTNLKENSTVYDLLQKLQQEGKITFRARNYDFGVFVEEIDGVKNSEKEKKYWMFYVNDKLSEVGASAKKLKNKDKVVWKFEKQ